MITEYIKRGYRKGYDAEGNLVYKIPVNEAFVPEQEELELEEPAEESEED
jgi:hypothetical protein